MSRRVAEAQPFTTDSDPGDEDDAPSGFVTFFMRAERAYFSAVRELERLELVEARTIRMPEARQ